MAKTWTVPDISEMTRGYQVASVLTAAADLEVFATLEKGPLTAVEIARKIDTDPRATTVLLDALAALELLVKRQVRYELAPGVASALISGQLGNVLAMTQHQNSCLRRWAQLATVVKTGRPAERSFGARGEAGDQASFIEAMDNISGPRAGPIVRELGAIRFTHLLDVGGGSGTWTIAWLRRNLEARATLFDLPPVIPMAEKRLATAGLSGRVKLVGGDFSTDPLPGGADLVWISAILHQDPREKNRALLAKAYQALAPGGQVMIRDILMDETRTKPAGGTLFAINMLVATEGGWTFTFEELRADLEAVGFKDVALIRKDDWMDNVVAANK